MDEIDWCSDSIEDRELKINIYKNHCLDEKIAFYKLMSARPSLMLDDENKLRYDSYIDDVIEYYKNGRYLLCQ